MRFLMRGAADTAYQCESVLTSSGISPVIARLLALRGIGTVEAARDFLCPRMDMLHDPFTLPGVGAAVQRIAVAIKNGEMITVYGDYDVDGVTATAILLGCLRDMGAKADYYIPSRHEEGYGLNESAVAKISEKSNLLITVDCGITACRETELAKSLGLEVIITDHHHPIGDIPSAAAVVNPIMGGYPCAHLCGAGVAFKLVHALGGAEAAVKWIDLAALGTVADIVPLTGENRVIASLGIAEMNKNLRAGIKALCEISGIRDKQISAGHLGFALGPRINAGGRIDRSSKSVDMLLTTDYEFALLVADQLNEHNRERQRQEGEIIKECEAQLDKIPCLADTRALILVGEGWNQGVVGIVASRLAERFCMPCVLLASSGGVLTGSGRSVKGVHLLNELSKCADLLTRFGGHEMAAGLTLPLENIDEFRRRFNCNLIQSIPDEVFEPSVEYDIEIEPGEATLELCQQAARLEPCGMGNPSPLFLLRDVRASDIRQIGAQKQHIKAVIKGDPPLWAVGFHMAQRQDALNGGFDALCELTVSEWNGRISPQAMLRRAEPSNGAAIDRIAASHDEYARDFLWNVVYNECGRRGEAGAFSAPVKKRGSIWLTCDKGRAGSLGPEIPLWIREPDKDKRAFCGVCAYPVISENFAGYSDFYLLDGADAPLMAAIWRRFPQARIYAASGEAGLYKEAFLPVESMRDIYAFIRKKACRLNVARDSREAAEAAKAETGISRQSFYFALIVFCQLGFIDLDIDKWSLRIKPDPGKTNLEQSPLYALASRLPPG